MIVTTERLGLRRMTFDDRPAIARILQDPVAMKAYEHAFTDQEVDEWIERQIGRYAQYDHGLWAVILTGSGELIGQTGLTMQDTDRGQVLEIGYLFARKYWHCGYATEAAEACKRYAFDRLNANEVYSIIRDTNLPSQRVALRLGMTPVGRFVKHYYGVDMPHDLYRITRQEDGAARD